MPYRPEADLKRPDLKGEFLCGHCGKTFCHAASLNRHRLNFHGDDQHCQLCDAKIPAHETVRRHMGVHHAINRVFTCGCCNWTFPDKKELHAHNNSMMRTGHPGEAKAIAISSRPPGSLSQAELRGEEHGSPRPAAPKSAPRKKDDKPNAAQLLFGQLMSAQSQSPSQVTVSADWLNAFVLNNPTLLPLLHHLHAAGGDTEITPSTSIDEETSSQNKNLINNNNIEFSVLNVKTENDVVLSGPESGIASGEEVTETDSSPANSSKEGSPIANDNAPPSARKRKSVDAIASLLFKKKCMMG
ncbi:Zinc finger putative Transcription Factor family [Trichostrongylus colubriformis]|uniref:Zinc finger putative Transcription Factor family n=1 Tax=Trichostrongylus colubriformis TaxID=6319 RepID=A0AAN8FQX6_TRICO